MASEAEKGKSTAREGGAARPRARKSPTLTEMVDAVMDRVNELRLAQEAIRAEAVHKLERIELAIANLSAFVTKVYDRQASQDAELAGLWEKLESLQKWQSEFSAPRKTEIPPEVMQQVRREATQPQSVPRMRVKVLASKRQGPVYPDSDSDSPREQPPKKTQVAPKTQKEGSERSPSPSPAIPTPPMQLPSPKPEGAPSSSEKAPPQQHPMRKATPCPKCNFKHKGNCVMPLHTCFRCLQPGHVAKECQAEKVCGNCRELGHLAKGCLKKRVSPSE